MKGILKHLLVRLGILSKPLPTLPKVVERYGERLIADAITGNKLIQNALIAQVPFLAGKLGSVELTMLLDSEQRKWKTETLHTLNHNAGFFPTSPNNCEKLANLYKQILQTTDILAVWFNEKEDTIVEEYAPQARLVRLRSLEPYYHENPWSEALAGKTVLIVHPFTASIQKQFEENRTRLFPNPQVLPPFTLKTLKAVQSIADNKTKVPFKDWFEALNYMQNEIQKIDFDVAIIGAGAYGLPLASFVKSIGRQAIHMGGATQILFGVFGNRWEDNTIIKGFQNEYWVRPSGEEIPEGAGKVEGACYW
jgi:hypothetical protein